MIKFICSLVSVERLIAMGVMIPIILILFVVIRIPFMAMAESECLEKGYQSYRLDYKFDTYCVNTFDGITKIVPLNNKDNTFGENNE